MAKEKLTPEQEVLDLNKKAADKAAADKKAADKAAADKKAADKKAADKKMKEENKAIADEIKAADKKADDEMKKEIESMTLTAIRTPYGAGHNYTVDAVDKDMLNLAKEVLESNNLNPTFNLDGKLQFRIGRKELDAIAITAFEYSFGKILDSLNTILVVKDEPQATDQEQQDQEKE